MRKARLFMECQQDVTLTTSSICTQPPLYSFPLTQLDLTACVRNSGILHSSLSRHSSVHKPGPLLCVHTFVLVHVKFISRRRKKTTSQIESAASTFIKIPQAILFSHSSVRRLHLMLDQHNAPVRPPYPLQPPISTHYPHPNPLSTSLPTSYLHPHPLSTPPPTIFNYLQFPLP